jgi:hypothetical protein
MGSAAVSGPDALAVLCWLHGDSLIERLEREVDDLADDSRSLDDAERGFREADLAFRRSGYCTARPSGNPKTAFRPDAPFFYATIGTMFFFARSASRHFG